jgi:F0F1-type ATP synthase epsilon subunit
MIEEQDESAKTIARATSEVQQAKERYDKEHPSMHIKVYSPYKSYFDDQGESISAVNATGPFDILPQHHRFMTLLSPCEVVIRTKQREEKIRISGGLMHVKADQVTVFLDI